MTTIEADVDYNVILHFGYLRNLDLTTRGIYYIKAVASVVRLADYTSYIKNGSKGALQEVVITPVGCFAAPSSLDATIGVSDLSCPVPIQNGYVEESDKSFRSRSMVVRYRDEVHELNDGAHWRITSPKAKLSLIAQDSIPSYEHLLMFKLELMFAPLLDDDSIDAIDEIDQLIPETPIFTSIASQTLCLQKIGSGFHEYFPVMFSRLNSIHLDCMIHCAATSITYRTIEASWISMHKSDEHEFEVVNDLSGDSFVSVASRRASRASEFEPILPTTVKSSNGLYCCGLNEIAGVPLDPMVDVATDFGNIYAQSMEAMFPTSYEPIIEKSPLSSPLPPSLPPSNIKTKRQSVPIPVRVHINDVYHNPLNRHLHVDADNGGTIEDKKEGDGSHLSTPTRDHPILTPDTSPILEHAALGSMEYVTQRAYIVHDLNDSFSSQTHNSTTSPPPQHYGSPARIIRASFFAESPRLSSPDLPSSSSSSSVGYHKSAISSSTTLTPASHHMNTSYDGADFMIYDILDDHIRFTEAEVKDLYHLKTCIAIRNYEALHDNVMELIHIIDTYDISHHHHKDVSYHMDQYIHDHEYDFQAICCLSLLRKEMIDAMMLCNSKTDALLIFDRLMMDYNIELTRLWSDFLSSVRKAMPIIRDVLKYEYDIKIRQYWKRQLLVQTCSSSFVRRPHQDEVALLDNLYDKLRFEESQAYVQSENSYDIPVIARNMHVFEANTHTMVSKLPVMLLQQYMPESIGAPLSSSPSVDMMSSNMSSSSKSSTSTFMMPTPQSSTSSHHHGSSSMRPPPSPYVHMGDIYHMSSFQTDDRASNSQNSSYNHSPPMNMPATPMIHMNDIYHHTTSAPPTPMDNYGRIHHNHHHMRGGSQHVSLSSVHAPGSSRSNHTAPFSLSSKSPMLSMGDIYANYSFISSHDNELEESVIRGGYIMNSKADVSQSMYEDIITATSLQLSSSSATSSSSSSFFSQSPSQSRKLSSSSHGTISHHNNSGAMDLSIDTRASTSNIYPSRFAPRPLSPTLSISPSSSMNDATPSIPPRYLSSAVELSIDDTSTYHAITTQNRHSFFHDDHSGSNVMPPKVWRHHILRWKQLISYDPTNKQPHLITDHHHKHVHHDAKHLIVLVHGFQGSSQDMRLLACQLLIAYPSYHILCTKSNDSHNEDSIKTMGHRMAEEVHVYCKNRCPDLLLPDGRSRISFIAHSMGGLVVRKALESPLLAPLLSKMHAYISLSSPHMGTLLSESHLVSTGMWALSLMKRNQCKPLKELVLEDALTGRHAHSLVYQLSENGMFKHFQKIILVSSIKDQYVPAYSARVQVPKTTSDPKLGPILVTMSANLMSQVDASSVYRLIIDNNVGEVVNVDSMIGRTAHISYLENPTLVEELVYVLYPLLQ